MSSATLHNFTAWFEERPRREQRVLGTLLILTAAALLWWVALSPALQTYQTSRANHAKLDADLAHMQIMANEAKRIKALPSPHLAGAQAWLESAIKKLGKASMSTQGGRIQINFAGASPEALATWLAQARTSAHLTPVQANWQRMATSAGGDKAEALWNGTLVFELPIQ